MVKELDATKVLQDLARHDEQLKHLAMRDEEFRKMVASVHQMSGNVEILVNVAKENSILVKEQNAHIAQIFKEKSESYDKRFSNQGQRLGTIEGRVTRVEKDVAGLVEKMDSLRMEPGNKWKSVTMAAILAVVGAVIGFLSGNFI